MKIAFRLLVLVGAVRLLWISAILYAPFIADSDTPSRRCAGHSVTLRYDSVAGTVVGPDGSVSLATSSEFAPEPLPHTAGMSIIEMKSAECTWMLGIVPHDAARGEVRRFGVALRHREVPVVVVSQLPAFPFSLAHGVLARAAYLTFSGPHDLLRSPRLLVSAGVSVACEEATRCEITLP